jgi:biotin synthase
MNRENTQHVLDRVYAAQLPCIDDIAYLLDLQDEEAATLFNYADKVRHDFAGDEILLRAIVEFSNVCRNTCFYCGLNKNNKTLQRYCLSREEIMAAVKNIASTGIKTVVLQSGEDDGLDAVWLEKIIEDIKTDFDIAMTLSVGERDFDEYAMWRRAGADRFLLKIETSNKQLYESLHPAMSFENRLRCLRDLKLLGYQTGSGNIVGLKGQTIRHLAEDILFFKREDFDMIGIGPFIPHKSTPMRDEPTGNLDLTLKVIAVTRIVTKNAHLPASTAVGSVGQGDARIKAFKCGANAIMPNFTPTPYKKLYEVYPGKRCVDEQSNKCLGCVNAMAKTINRTIEYSRGDSLKIRTKKQKCLSI